MTKLTGTFIALLAALTFLSWPGTSCAQYVVTDAQVSDGVYEFLYSPKTSSADSGGVAEAGDPWLGPTGWTHHPNRTATVGYWRLPGASWISPYSGPGVIGTVGFDLSAVTLAIQKVEIDPSHHLFCYISSTAGHTITGEVATPASFGTGAFTQLYHYVAPLPYPNGCPFEGALGPVPRVGNVLQPMIDITASLPGAWLSNPALLEFRFSHDKAGGGTIVAENTQVFREDGFHKVGETPYGFRVRIEFGPQDSDGDGVVDTLDACAGTVLPEGAPTGALGVNRWALVDGDGIFDTTSPRGGGKGPQLSFTIEDTAGCSCEQIIEALGLGKGHTRHGCSISAMETFVELVNP